MVGFTEESARAVGKATQWVAAHKTTQPSRSRGRWGGWSSRWELGKTDASISAGGSVTVSIWKWNGSTFVDSGENVTAYDWMLSGSQAIASGKKVVVLKHRRNVWVIVSAECA